MLEYSHKGKEKKRDKWKMQDLWDTIKTANLKIKGKEEGENMKAKEI
jgi:hypothetical protein